jgi:poly-gamma-glutamate synthesis protein (capsule biosynthesis protein)
LPAFAGALAWAGVDVVSTANNHALDAGEEGLFDTLRHLSGAGVAAAGTGRDLDEARRPAIVERHGLRFAFLAYSRYDNRHSGFALPGRSGAAPLDPFLVEEDVRRARAEARADHVVLSFHWGRENTRDVPGGARRLARAMVDAGADVVLGHHPHLPGPSRPTGAASSSTRSATSSSGHARAGWGDNLLARITFAPGGIARAEVLAVAGTGRELAQPFLLGGARARRLLEDIGARSAELGTRVRIADGVGSSNGLPRERDSPRPRTESACRQDRMSSASVVWPPRRSGTTATGTGSCSYLDSGTGAGAAEIWASRELSRTCRSSGAATARGRAERKRPGNSREIAC